MDVRTPEDTNRGGKGVDARQTPAGEHTKYRQMKDIPGNEVPLKTDLIRIERSIVMCEIKRAIRVCTSN